MYNGIGLTTARGSGTNGFVQRNLCFVRKHKDKIDYKSEEELKKLDLLLNKQPNVDILEHERKRKVELKCMEMHELMEEQGYSVKEIEGKVSVFRKMLMDKEGVVETSSIERDQFGRPLAKETHQIAEANQAKNAKLREAFGLTDYVEGSAFDKNHKAKQEAARALAMAQKKYSTVESSDSDEKSPSHPPKKKKKKSGKKHRDAMREASSSPDRKERRKKSKKHKSDRSLSRKHKKSRKHRKRSLEKKKKRKTKESSSSSSEGESDSESVSSLSSVEVTPERNANPPNQVPRGRGRHVNSSPGPTDRHNDHRAKNGTVLSTKARSRSLTYSPEDRRRKKLSSQKNNANSNGRRSRSPRHSRRHSRSRSPTKHKGRLRRSRKSSRSPSDSRSRSRSRSRSPTKHNRRQRRTRKSSRSPSESRSRSRSRSRRSRSRSGRRSYSRSASRSRSPSIRRRKGSPSHLDKRRITRSRDRTYNGRYRDSPTTYRSRKRY